MKRLIATAALVLLLAAPVRAQYWGERVLEKSFEHTDFFFEPSRLNPYGVHGFGSAAYGLVQEPLVQLGLNPAYLLDDSLAVYGYLDVRGTRDVEQPDAYSIYGSVYDSRYLMTDVYFPRFYVQTYQALEPVVSAALLGRPFGQGSPFALGVTYQAIFQDEAYYGIPVGLYRSNVGLDYAGNRMAAESDVPVTDRYLGEDNLRSMGHFATAFAGWRIGQRLDVTARLGTVLFDRDGARGDQNLWPNDPRRTSFWRHVEERSQDYDHWDVGLGLNAHLSGAVTVGVTAGYLDGQAQQRRSRADSSYYRYDRVSDDEYGSLYMRGGADREHWQHDGQTVYGGANLSAQLAPDRRLSLYYRLYHEDVDIDVRAAIRDTSYSVYGYTGASYSSESESYYGLSDVRSGGGTRDGWTHRATAAWQWAVGERTHLSFGVGVRVHQRTTRTTEDVDAWRQSYSWHQNMNDGTTETWEYYSSTDEVKELRWTFEVDEVSVHVPLLLRRELGDAVEVLFGLQRVMTRRELSDVTLAVFDYRTEVADEQTTHREDFGERYSVPSERRSDVETTVLTGLTVRPADALGLRLLVVPYLTNVYGNTELRHVQWWLGITVGQ